MLNKNLKVLQQQHAGLAELIKKSKKVDWIQKRGKEEWVNEPRRGWRKCSKEELPDDLNCYKQDVTVQIGAGHGKLLKALLDKAEDGHKLILVEPIPYMIKLAFKKYDFTEHMKKGLLTIVNLEHEFDICLGIIESAQAFVNNWAMIFEDYVFSRPEYAAIVDYTQKRINQTKCNIGTVCGNGAQIAANDVLTVPDTILCRGVNELHNLYYGNPAICVATGPSLEKNIHQLKEAQGKAVIICAAQALRVLLAYDVKPTFACTVDFGIVNYSHFEGLLGVYDYDIPLVAINRTYYKILQQWQGPLFISANNAWGDDETVVNLLADKGLVEQGGSVSHMCFGLAKHIGCSTVAFIGQDLSYGPKDKMHRTHNRNADASGTVALDGNNIRWTINDQRGTLDKQTVEFDAVAVEGYYGEPVITNAGLETFITAFEAMTKTYDGTVYNCTQGGARIKGTRQMLLKSYIDQFCQDKIPTKGDLYIDPTADTKESIKKQIDKAIVVLEKEIPLYREVEEHAGAAVELCTVMLEFLEENKVDEYTDAIKWVLEQSAFHTWWAQYVGMVKLPLLNMGIFAAREIRFSREVQEARKGGEGILFDHDKFMIRLKANYMICEAARDAAEMLGDACQESLDRLKEFADSDYNMDILKPPFEPPEPDLSDAESYLEKGNFAHVDLETRRDTRWCAGRPSLQRVRAKRLKQWAIAEAKAKEPKADYGLLQDYWWQGVEAGRKGDFETAIKMLNQAYNIDPSHKNTCHALAGAYARLGQLGPAIVLYDGLIKMHPKEHVFRYEKAQTLLSYEDVDKKNEGFKLLQSVLNESFDYDQITYKVGKLCEDIGDDDAALICYERYTKFAPDDPAGWLAKGKLIFKLAKNNAGNIMRSITDEQRQGWLKQAEACMVVALGIDKGNVEIETELAYIRKEQEQ